MYRNITLSAEQSVIQKARRRAAEERKSLNAVFREWIARYIGADRDPENYRQLMKQFKHVQPGRTFARDEMNER